MSVGHNSVGQTAAATRPEKQDYAVKHDVDRAVILDFELDPQLGGLGRHVDLYRLFTSQLERDLSWEPRIWVKASADPAGQHAE